MDATELCSLHRLLPYLAFRCQASGNDRIGMGIIPIQGVSHFLFCDWPQAVHLYFAS